MPIKINEIIYDWILNFVENLFVRRQFRSSAKILFLRFVKREEGLVCLENQQNTLRRFELVVKGGH